MKSDSLAPYAHQTQTTNFILKTPRCLITSDPGTGKTRSVLDALIQTDSEDIHIAAVHVTSQY